MRPGKAVPSSRTRCALTACIVRVILHNTQMPLQAAIVGCAGYAGQETLDRVLAHPELEAVALGSDSLAGRPAAELDPRLPPPPPPAFVPNADALAADADVFFLCLGHDEAAAVEPPAGAVV